MRLEWGQSAGRFSKHDVSPFVLPNLARLPQAWVSDERSVGKAHGQKRAGSRVSAVKKCLIMRIMLNYEVIMTPIGRQRRNAVPTLQFFWISI